MGGDRTTLLATPLLHGLVLLAALSLALLSYLPLRSAELTRPDRDQLSRAGALASGSPLDRSVLHGPRTPHDAHRPPFRPVTLSSFALEWWVAGGPDARTSRLINLLTHVAVSLVLFALVLRLGGRRFAAVTAALLFVAHPVHSEAVGSLGGRGELLAALFTLLGLLALRSAGDGRVSARLCSLAAAASLFLALGSEDVALASFPLFLVLGIHLGYGGSQPGRSRLRVIGMLTPSAVAFGVYVVLGVSALGARPWLRPVAPLDNALALLPAAERLPVALGHVARYSRLLVYPVGLSADYSGHAPVFAGGGGTARAMVGLLVLLCTVLLAVAPWLRRPAGRAAQREPRTIRLYAFGAALLLLPLLVNANLLFPSRAGFAERFLYLPTAGFCLLLGLLLGGLRETYPAFPHWSPAQRAQWVRSIVAILLAAFVLLTWQRAAERRTEETLYAAALRAVPGAPRAHLVLAEVRARQGRTAEAQSLLDGALHLWPDYAEAARLKGDLLIREGRPSRAADHFRAALRARPDDAEAHLGLGLALEAQGRRDEAERSFRKALLYDPDLREAREALAGPRHAPAP